MTGVLLVGSLTLLASFCCSLLEAVLYAITPARIEVLKERGVKGARRLARLRAGIDEPIAAILTVNTIAHTVGAAWCGAMVGEIYGNRAVGFFAAIFTILILSVTEIVPKSIGVRHAGRLGPAIVWPLQIMIWSVWPIVWLARRAMGALSGPNAAAGPTEEEVIGLSSLAARGGAVRFEEHRWVCNALRLDRVTAGDLRTPRTVVESLPADTPVREMIEHGRHWVHSRVPLMEEDNVDRVVGLVHRREVFDAALEHSGRGLVLRDLMRPIRFVPESMPAHELLDLFLEERAHLAAVVDEYGGFEGVVTLEDVLECLLGEEIVDEHDREDDMQALALKRGRLRRDRGEDEQPQEPATDRGGSKLPRDS